MNFYYLTDESEKSLAPFFSKHVLETRHGRCCNCGGLFDGILVPAAASRINCSR